MDWGKRGIAADQTHDARARVVPNYPLGFMTASGGCARPANRPLFLIELHSAVHRVVHCVVCVAYRRSATAYDVAATLLVAGLDPLDQLGDLVVDLSSFGHQRPDLFHSMDDGGVVASAELAGDGGIAEIGELSCDVHRDLT